MSEVATTLYDEEVLHGDQVPDAALELAASKLCDGPPASFTLSFCSGLDTCPTSPRNKFCVYEMGRLFAGPLLFSPTRRQATDGPRAR